MSKMWQVFAAPDDGSQNLPIAPSPWHAGRFTYIPREHWTVLLAFAEQIDPQRTSTLRSLSRSQNLLADDEVHAPEKDLKAANDFIRHLQSIIARSASLINVLDGEVAEYFENDEYVRMLEAVAAVLRESLRLGKPFRAWVE